MLLTGLSALICTQTMAQPRPIANDDFITVTQGACQIVIPVASNDVFLPVPGRPRITIVSPDPPFARATTDSFFNVFYCLIDSSFTGVHTFQYQLCDSTPQGGILCDTANVTVHVLPPNPPSGIVWPGDANSDGITNVFDILPIGRNFQRNGPARFGPPNIQYNPFQAPFWIGDTLFNGVNMHHADCNGDGIINFQDTIAVSVNYGLTHPKTDGVTGDCNVDPPLFIEIIGPSVPQSGDTLELKISLGTSALPATSARGAAVQINYNLPVLDSVVFRDMSNSWLYSGNLIPSQANGMSMVRHFPSQQQIDVAITRISPVPAAMVSGEIGSIIVIIDDNLSGKTTGLEDLIFNISAGQTLSAGGQILPICYKGDTITMNRTTGIKSFGENLGLRVVPNPSRGTFRLSWDEGQCELLELIDMNGSSILSKPLEAGSSSAEVDLSQYGAGVYYARLSGQNGHEIQKIIITP